MEHGWSSALAAQRRREAAEWFRALATSLKTTLDAGSPLLPALRRVWYGEGREPAATWREERERIERDTRALVGERATEVH